MPPTASIDPRRRVANGAPCKVSGCPRVRYGRFGFCRAHTDEWCQIIPPGCRVCSRCGLVTRLRELCSVCWDELARLERVA